jgi:hypothetical protein
MVNRWLISRWFLVGPRQFVGAKKFQCRARNSADGRIADAVCGGLGLRRFPAPDDVAEITALAAATMVWEYLALYGTVSNSVLRD